MRWNDRQQAMLREMGIRLWLPAEADAADPVAAAGQAPVFENEARAEPAPVRADWVLVGDAPDVEDRDGDSFAGRAGQLLDNMLRAVGRVRGEAPPERRVHAIAAARSRLMGNGDTDAAELEGRQASLRREIEQVRPRLVIALGRSVAQALLQTEESFSRLRGRVHRYQELPLVVTFAPAYLLRHPQDKAGAWDDLCLTLEIVNDSSPR